jgi:hypothetical protein
LKTDRLIDSIDALIALDDKGATVPRVPGLAKELLVEARTHLSQRVPLFDRSAVQGIIIACAVLAVGYVGFTCTMLVAS